MRIAIVDDIAQERALFRARLDEALMKHDVQAEIVEFERGETFLQAASQQPFTVVFLDIFMGGTNGVEIAKQLREFDKDCMIAFSTTSTDYALEGLRVRATQYLVKPYTQKDIDDLLGEILPRLPKLDDSVSLRVNGGDVQLCLKDMVYAEHFSHLIHVVTSFGRTLVTRLSLAAFIEPLKEDSRFFNAAGGETAWAFSRCGALPRKTAAEAHLPTMAALSRPRSCCEAAALFLPLKSAAPNNSGLYRIGKFGYNNSYNADKSERFTMNIAFDTYKQKLNDCRPALDGLADSLNVEGLRSELERLHAMQEAPGLWDDPEKSQKVAVKTRQTEAKIERYEKMRATWDDLMTICEMAAEEDDDSMLEELQTGYETLAEEMEVCRLETLLTGHYDKNNALMSFHAGAGGTEAQDWCQMLYRMYTRWAERHGFTYKILDYLEGDEAGLKSADIMIEGENAYGFLKGENGVHRLVRVSPFDANARRQTSFSAIEVIPDIEDESQDVEIRPEDYEMQVYRSSGAGGQHINKTSSAVRLIHKATGIVVSCQTERSQFQNKETCLRMLRSKLVEIKEREHLDKISDIKGVQQKIEWGSQIRNYVFMPYTLVKDTRTGCETSNVNAVMDGALDPFIESYLNCLATGNWVQK